MTHDPRNNALTLLFVLLALPTASAVGEDKETTHMSKTSQSPSPRRAIDPALFVAAGPDIRSFEVEELIGASAEDVFAAFTDGAAFKRAYGPDREELAANIDLAIGGRYEWLFDGEIGSNGCQVLSYVPNRMVSFSWNAPTAQPESRALRTWVVVELTPEGPDSTHVRITHLGFGAEAHWDETFAYFQRGWPAVLATLKKNLEG